MRIENESGCAPGPASRARVRVAVVDELPVVREGARALLREVRGIEAVSTHESLEALLQAPEAAPPQVVLLEPRLRGARIGTSLDALRRRLPTARVLVWYAAISAQERLEAAARGVAGFLAKQASAADTAQAILDAACAPADRPGRARLAGTAGRNAPERLTPREFSVLGLLCEGKSNTEIAAALGISHGTTKVYMSRVLAKLGAQDRTHAVVLSLRERLVAPPS